MKLLRIYFRFLVLLLPVVTGAQALPTLELAQVVVEGNERASADVIRSTSKLYPGRSVTALDVQRGIQRLWDLGFFGDIQIYRDAETDSGVVMRIAVKEYPSLEKIEFKGNKKISKSKIEDEIELRSPKILTDYAVSEAVRKIKRLYYDDGYLNVEIETDQEPGLRTYGRVLVISITENKKVKLRRIHFNGNQAFSNFRLRRQLKETKSWHWYTFWRSPLDRDKFQDDLFNIEAYYRDRGYRDGRVLRDTVIATPNGKGLELVIDIYEGVPYYYRNFTWEGNTLHSDEELERALGFKKGDLYNQERFEMAVSQRVHPVYMDEGYLYSRVEPVEYPVGQDSIDVVFSIAENQKVAVRYINITGNDKTRDYVVRRELRIHPGDIFSYEKLGRSQRDVWILNYFDNVEPNVLPVDEDEVDLSIQVTERSTERANLSIGYTEQYGMIGGGGLEFMNLAGTGQQLNLSYNRGADYNLFGSGAQSNRGAYQSLSLGLVNPWLFNTPNLVGLSLFYSERGASSTLYLPFDIIQRGGSARWGRRFRWPDSYFRGSWIFRGSEKRYVGDQESLQDYLGVPDKYIQQTADEESYVSTVGISVTQAITRDSRNRPEFPTSGSELNLVSTISGMALGGHEDFHKHVFTVRWYVPLVSSKLVFFQSSKLGLIKQIRDPGSRSILPPEEKFYLGGTGIPYGEMLRGYRDNTVGPYLGRPLGASALFKYSAELRLSLSQNPTIFALVFMDLGNSWLDFSYVDPFKLKRSAGVGVRMFMPMLGMLGLDMGYGFDSAGSDTEPGPRGWEMHFIFGQPF